MKKWSLAVIPIQMGIENREKIITNLELALGHVEIGNQMF